MTIQRFISDGNDGPGFVDAVALVFVPVISFHEIKMDAGTLAFPVRCTLAKGKAVRDTGDTVRRFPGEDGAI